MTISPPSSQRLADENPGVRGAMLKQGSIGHCYCGSYPYDGHAQWGAIVAQDASPLRDGVQVDMSSVQSERKHNRSQCIDQSLDLGRACLAFLYRDMHENNIGRLLQLDMGRHETPSRRRHK